MPAGLIVKAGTLNKSRRNCFIVVMRSQRTGNWEPISTNGFVVVCPSKLEAFNLVWWIGGRLHVGPAVVADDDVYLDWLLQHYFKIVPWEAGPMDERGVGVRGNLEVMFSMFMRGWQPTSEDLSASPTVELVQRILELKNIGR